MTCFKLPNGESRFFSRVLESGPGSHLYIDHSTWCLHGEYVAGEKNVLVNSPLSALLAGVHPFTIGWIGDLHATGEAEERLSAIAALLSALNPTLTVLLGDLVNGSGDYTGSDMDDSWFANVWNTFKRTPNLLWVKGNHDIDPGHYEFYDWSEELWSLNIGVFKLVAFDTFDEGRVIRETSHTFISASDTIWRLKEDDRVKIVLAHHLFSQWRPFAYLALKKAVNLRYVFSAHDHKAYTGEIGDVKVIVNGTGAPAATESVACVFTGFKNGDVAASLVKSVDVAVEDGHCSVTAELEKLEGFRLLAPVRLTVNLRGRPVNLYVMIGEDGEAELEIDGNRGEIASTVDLFMTGKEISVEGAELYDFWRCPCGAEWRSFHIKREERACVKIR